MSGRAGRMGVTRSLGSSKGQRSTAGEAILIMPCNSDLEVARDLISSPLKPLKSALRTAAGGGLERALLEVVVSGVVRTASDARRFVSFTLLAARTPAEEWKDDCDAALSFLLDKYFLIASYPGKVLSQTGMFRAVYPGRGEGVPARAVGEAAGIQAGVLVNASGQHKPAYGERTCSRPGSDRAVNLLPYRRFFAALILEQSVQEVPVQNMAKHFNVSRGALQALQKDASAFCGMVVCFCKHLHSEELATVLSSFQDRLSYSAKPELLPLVSLSGDLPPFHARVLVKAGYPIPLHVAAAPPGKLAEVFLGCVPFQSAKRDEYQDSYRRERARVLAERISHLVINEARRQSSALGGPGRMTKTIPKHEKRAEHIGEAMEGRRHEYSLAG
ncbi:unnamed protein product [Discosporangium mesarthrocarpum]